MNIVINKEEYVQELEKVLKYYYESKAIGDKEQIKYFQGMVKGMLFILKKQKIFTETEIKDIAKDVELDIPSIYRGEDK